jgi:outer membrane protein insertion porin family/translocation and assembly module TamA
MSVLGFGARLIPALVLAACAAAPPAGHDVVSALSIHGGAEAEDPALEKGIATREGDVLDTDVLQKDLERVERFYRDRGYYDARVGSARVVREGKQAVRVEIDVLPGEPVRVARLEVLGLDQVPAPLAKEARSALRLVPGQRFVKASFHEDARRVEAILTDAGFAFAKVTESARLSMALHSVRVEYRVSAGPSSRFGTIKLEGFRRIDADVARATLGFEKGESYSRSKLEQAKQRLFGLGVFRTVEIVPVLEHPERGEVPVHVVVAEGTPRSVHAGVALEQDTVRGLAGVRLGWENRNFLGGLRKFSAEATPAVIFYPIGEEDVAVKALASVSSKFRLEQPAFLDARTTGFVESGVSAYPVLYSDFSPTDNLIGFFEIKGATGIERPLGDGTFHIRPSYNVQASFPFMYIGDKPEGLDTAYVLYPEIVASADLRDNPIEPRKGAYFEIAAQVAGVIAGDATDLRFKPELRFYAKLGRPLTLAFRTTLGFLFPKRCGNDPTTGCYGDSLESETADAQDAASTRDQQILLFRALYSGGSTSNRGYALHEVGPHGTLGFLVPSNVNCAVPNPPSQCIRPLGGLTLWEQSIELRWTLSDLAGVVFFVEGSDVTRGAASFRLGFPHISAGSGFRLRTPVGAARLDVGLRIPYLQQVGEPELPASEGDPDTFLGAPMAVHFGLGEAF